MLPTAVFLGFPGGSVGKESACNEGDLGLIPGSGAVQGTSKSLLWHYSSKASILQHSAFFIVHTLTSIRDYWKNHSLD